MTEDQVPNLVREAYGRDRKDLTDVHVTYVRAQATGGYLVAVEATDEDDDEIEEICTVSANGKVRIFQATDALLDELAAPRSIGDWLFSTPVVTGIAFLGTLAAVIVLPAITRVEAGATDALKGTLALAAGFYFGNKAR